MANKKLSQMTLEELWDLFPIFLVAPTDKWARFYEEEEGRIKAVFPPETIKRISHVGSTAIKGIWAKNIVDILVEIDKCEDIRDVAGLIEKNGYIVMSASPERVSFNRGYTEQGFAERVFHLHLRYEGNNDELYFRDYLNDHPLVAKEYEKLKLSLWKKYEHDRDGYTLAKTDFIRTYTQKAKQLYGERYEK